MTPETKAKLDDLEQIAKGLNDAIENVAITGWPCELHSFYVDKDDKLITEKIASETLTKLLVIGLSAELRSIEGYVTRRAMSNENYLDTAIEIVERIHEIRKMI